MAEAKAGTIIAELQLRDDQFSSSMKKAADLAQTQTKKIASAVESVGGALGVSLIPNGIAASAVIYKAVDAMHELAEVGDKAMQAGLGVEQFQKLSYAAKLSGVTMDEVSVGLTKLKKNLYEAATAGGAPAEALQRLGLDAGELAAMTPDVALGKLADALNKIPNPTERAALTMQVLGKNGQALAPLLAEGSEGLKDMGDEADEIGATVDDLGVSLSKVADDDMEKIKTAAGGVWKQLATKLAPVFIEVSENILDFIKSAGGAKVVAENVSFAFQTAGVVVLKLKYAFEAVQKAVVLATEFVILSVKSALYPLAYAIEKIVNGAITARNKLAKLRDSAATEWKQVDLTSGLAQSIRDSASDVTDAFRETANATGKVWDDTAENVVTSFVEHAEEGAKKLADKVTAQRKGFTAVDDFDAPVKRHLETVGRLGEAWKGIKQTMLEISVIAQSLVSSSNRELAKRAEIERQRAAEAEKAGRFAEADRRTRAAERIESRIKRRPLDEKGRPIDLAADENTRRQAIEATERVATLAEQAAALRRMHPANETAEQAKKRQKKAEGMDREAREISDKLKKRGFGSSILEASLQRLEPETKRAADGIDQIKADIARLVQMVGLAA